MKTIGLFAVLAILLLSVVSAVDMVITPQMVTLEPTDSKDVVVCVYRADASPYVGLDLSITSVCQDLNGDEACGPAEDGNAVGIFNAVVKTSPTDANGCGEVTLSTTNALGGMFAYSVLSENANVKIDEETGLAFVPEMGIIGAGLVLAGAGLFIAKKRKE